MVDLRKVAGANLTSVVDWFGCYDAAAETINARWHKGSSKGTISRKVSGQLDWTVADLIALEDASGRYPVTRLLMRRIEHRPIVSESGLIHQSGKIAKESGEAISAILAAEQSSDADDVVMAIKEIDDAMRALAGARGRLEERDAD